MKCRSCGEPRNEPPLDLAIYQDGDMEADCNVAHKHRWTCNGCGDSVTTDDLYRHRRCHLIP